MPDMRQHENKVFVVNKGSGPTSFEVVDAFRRATGIRKVGHTGTLDPLAEGVLVLCTGRATRAVEHFMNLPKEYHFTVRLGIETTTLDAEGDVVKEAPVPDLSEQAIHDVVAEFVGQYDLNPPAYSALKQNGRRLYEMARAGETPIVESRTVTIYSMDVMDVALPDVRISIRCSRGTYVRSLAKDFGARFDLPAHILRLIRTSVGPFNVADAFPGEKLFEGRVEELSGIDLSVALDFLPGIVLTDTSKKALFNGALPCQNDVLETIGQPGHSAAVRILDKEGVLLAVGSRAEVSKRFTLVDSYRLMVDGGSVTT
jgi:tRNA pseudouridine55 synthase